MLFMLSLSELTRAEKKTMYNCFTTSADINLFADTMQITVTLTSTKSASCDIPHGVFVSLQIDSLGSYEPSAYVQDFAYDSPQQIRLACADPVECAKIKAAESGTIVLETKTHATFVPAGSIRVSKGLSSSCFHDNDSFVELYQGAVVLVLYPTFTCKDSIAKDQMGQLKLNALSKVKMYITYTDDSISIHDQLALTLEQDLFVPTVKVLASSTPVRIKLSNPSISKFFEQKMVNGVASKDMALFQANLEYLTDDAMPLKKNAQVTVNFYKYMGITNAFSSMNLQLLNTGFLTSQTLGSFVNNANQLITDLGVTYYTFQYVFTTYDVSKTEQFRMRLFGFNRNYMFFDESSFQNTCEVNFPGQKCGVLLEKLHQIPISQLQAYLNYEFYKDEQFVTNYTIKIGNIYGSCFSTGELDYDYKTQLLKISFDQNIQSKSCALTKNDAVVVKIMLGNNSQVLKTLNVDFVPGTQKYEVSGFDLELQPHIHVQYFKDNRITDAIALQTYTVKFNNALINKEIATVLYILAANLVFVILYLTWFFFLSPKLKECLANKHKVKTFKVFSDVENQDL
ncbi:Conserved_hypothetical protein [Hexamita inflata]|uniref:Uncharacterized protein n=1 Tax=Hexamita inflata TaxID=28002 RepID=A0AA86VSU6_9EUKA|nr:Conserved hypothetical protein [Hexamita inflata]